MRKILLPVFLITFSSSFLFSQDIAVKLKKALAKFESDSQLSHASIGFLVIDAKTGKTIVEKNPEIGLAPASCQKVLTAASAYELLGSDYKFKTEFRYDGTIADSVLKGNLYIIGKGDPSFASWRYTLSTPQTIAKELVDALHHAGVSKIIGQIISVNTGFDSQNIPDGWIWEDIGNYYGAGIGSLVWNENQFDLILKPGKNQGDSVKIIGTKPEYHFQLINELKTGAKESGDNAYMYFSPGVEYGYLRGTIPCCVDSFAISASVTDGEEFARDQIISILNSNHFFVDATAIKSGSSSKYNYSSNLIFTKISPSLDSLTYWFLKKSINLYGEAYLKSIALEKGGFASTTKGVDIVQDFWEHRGIERSSISIMDGSGLSPQNRITPRALVQILQYAKTRPWYNGFYNGLPEINGIHMKSGSIEGARSYTGYIKNNNGIEYTFAIIVNNFSGNASTVVRKMWVLLDTMK
ncbi:MAG: D-alanyl-D-alanine carboxypeptidase/D-alanyl-D-alanine-endopeptidase [Bacteroidetes bacterium]|nr:MAG: D-alanyl-D-alanine carboxypeptidase/D-alanyl-D-alanine-endopeptidase [Bacteroidota bacterium]